MSETRLAHFEHHWEAELAQGYLEDAGVPSRLVSDNLAGGYTYVGSASGASLLVPDEDLEEAHRVLTTAGVLRAAERVPAPALRALTPVERADRLDVRTRLEEARAAEVRHFIRCMLGVTPAAVIPAVGLAMEGSVALLALLCVLVTLVEGWRWVRAGRLVKSLQGELARLEAGAEPAADDGAAAREGP